MKKVFAFVAMMGLLTFGVNRQSMLKKKHLPSRRLLRKILLLLIQSQLLKM